MIRLTFTALLLLIVSSGTLNVLGAGGGSVSRDPSLKTDKAQIQLLQSFAPAQRRNPENDDNIEALAPANDDCEVGTLDDDICKVHPLVVTYMEEAKGNPGHFDIQAAASLDEGGSWKIMNLSKNADKSYEYHGRKCFTDESEDEHDGDEHESGSGHRLLEEEETEIFPYFGDNFKPMLAAKDNKILVAWTSTNCRGGVWGDEDGNSGVPDPNNYLRESDASPSGGTDRFQVKGQQTCFDYAGVQGLGKNPSSCVWAARGLVNTTDGTISWTKPERLTSGRRSAFQLVAAVAGNANAWALAWQEDPKGLRVGEAEGPGDGMSGATVNHKTDIWYGYANGTKAFDVGWTLENGSNMYTVPEKNRFSTPVRVTDNAACKVEHETDVDGNIVRDDFGNVVPKKENDSYLHKGGPYCIENCASLTENKNDIAKYPLSCISSSGFTLDGNTGASRPNMFLLPDADMGVRVVLSYEESKGSLPVSKLEFTLVQTNILLPKHAPPSYPKSNRSWKRTRKQYL